MPTNARTTSGGVRIYSWDGPNGPVEVLSVTSIRRLAGIPIALQNWQLSNVIRLAMGTRRVTVVGPRGGVHEEYVQDGPFPGEFAVRLAATEGDTAKLAELRKWMRQTADEPRDAAANRGSVVHRLIELAVRVGQLTDEYIDQKFEEHAAGERHRVKRVVLPDDREFVRHCMRQYWSMRTDVPFIILAQEPQVWNLTAGYAGSFDALIWVLPVGTNRTQVPVRPTVEDVARIGGELILADWKTSKDTQVDHAIQVTAYLAAEFVGTDGVIDERLTALLHAAMRGALIHIRPDGWSVEYLRFREDLLLGFLGSCAFARCLAMNPDLSTLIDEKVSGKAPDTDDSQYEVDDA